MSAIASLPACLVRIAQLQQNPIDRSALLQAVADVRQRKPKSPRQTVQALTRILMVPPPRWARKPDPANMPLLGHHPLMGWFVVRGQNAHKRWVIETWSEEQQKFVESISTLPNKVKTLLAKLSLLQPFDASHSPVYSLIINSCSPTLLGCLKSCWQPRPSMSWSWAPRSTACKSITASSLPMPCKP